KTQGGGQDVVTQLPESSAVVVACHRPVAALPCDRELGRHSVLDGLVLVAEGARRRHTSGLELRRVEARLKIGRCEAPKRTALAREVRAARMAGGVLLHSADAHRVQLLLQLVTPAQ